MTSRAPDDKHGEAFQHACTLSGHIRWLEQTYPDAKVIPADLRKIAEYLSARPSLVAPSLYDAAKDLHDYLWENVPDILDISTSSELAGEGIKKRLQALKDALKVAPAPTSASITSNDLISKARSVYGVEPKANITYPSRVAAGQVRAFIQELADAYERAIIWLEATQQGWARDRAYPSPQAPRKLESEVTAEECFASCNDYSCVRADHCMGGAGHRARLSHTAAIGGVTGAPGSSDDWEARSAIEPTDDDGDWRMRHVVLDNKTREVIVGFDTLADAKAYYGHAKTFMAATDDGGAG